MTFNFKKNFKKLGFRIPSTFRTDKMIKNAKDASSMGKLEIRKKLK